MLTYSKHKNPFLDRRPYIYALHWNELNLAYVGVRYAKRCHPDELWNTYFTSSNYVKDLRKQGFDPSTVEIIDTFLTAQEAIDAEQEIISLFELHLNTQFLNKNCAGAIVMDADVIAKLKANTANAHRWVNGNTPWNKGIATVTHSYNGQTLNLNEWVKLYPHLTKHQLNVRLNLGWTMDRALKTPVRQRSKPVSKTK